MQLPDEAVSYDYQGLLARPHGLDGLVLEVNHLARGERASWHAWRLVHPDELTALNSTFDLGLDRSGP